MNELFDVLGDLAQKAKASLQNAGQNGGQNGSGLGSIFGEIIGAAAGSGGTFARKAEELSKASGGLVGPAALAGVLGSLLISKSARDAALSAGKGALSLGGGAAVAAAAWDLYKKWSAQKSDPAASAPVGSRLGALSDAFSGPLPGADRNDGGDSEEDRRAGLLLRAMVFAARSDGHMDDEEKATINSALAGMGPEAAARLGALLNEPVDPATVAASVRGPEEARDVYRLSCLAVRVDQFMERNYLDALAAALGIAEPEKTALEREAEAMRGATA